jgi:hypothetical protein
LRGNISLKVAELQLRKYFLLVAELQLRTQKKVARAHLWLLVVIIRVIVDSGEFILQTLKYPMPFRVQWNKIQ